MKGAPHPTVVLSRARQGWLGSVFGTVPVDPTRRTIGQAARVVVVAVAGIGFGFVLRSAPELSALDRRGLVRRLWYKEHDSFIGWSRLAQIEHQTLLMLPAERGGVLVS